MRIKKRVDWDICGIDFAKPGEYDIKGNIHKDHFEFPVAFNRADPCIAFWNGKYYFIATNDADSNHSLYVREADTIPELVGAEEKLILDSDMYDYAKGLLWAPEFHEVEGKLYIFLCAYVRGNSSVKNHMLWNFVKAVILPIKKTGLRQRGL